MTREKLENLARIGQLKAQPPNRKEFDGLLSSGNSRLHDAQREELSLESRYQVFQCLQHTVDLEPTQWRVLDQAHRKRNLAEYEGHVEIDRSLVEATIRVAKEVEARVEELGSLT